MLNASSKEAFGTIFITSLVWRGQGSTHNLALIGRTLYSWATAPVYGAEYS